MKRFYERTKRLAQWGGLAAFLFMLPLTASAATRKCFATGNNVHYIEKGDEVMFVDWVNNAKLERKRHNQYNVVKGWFKNQQGEVITKLTADEPFIFNGPTGWYSFKDYVDYNNWDSNKNDYAQIRTFLEGHTDTKYLEVLPHASIYSGEEQYNNPNGGQAGAGFEDQPCTHYLKYDTSDGTGAIWVSGGPNFGFPDAAWTHKGWTGGDAERYGDNTTAMYRENKKYTIDITTGREMSMSDKFCFKFYHTKEYELNFTGNQGDWQKWHEFRGEEKNDGGTQCTIAFLNPSEVDYLQITTDKSGNSNPSYRNGNIEPTNVGKYSQLSNGYLPVGYTFNFTIDLDNLTSGWSYTHVPLGVTEVGVPTVVGSIPETKTLGTYNDVTVHLNNVSNGTGSKRIWLRDALRFDAGMLYKYTYHEGASGELYHIKNLTITGDLNAQDMEYLGWLVRNNAIEHLDLTQATVPNNTVPEEWAKGSTSLQTIKVPISLAVIENSAFEDCENLSSVVLSNLDGVSDYVFTVREKAFKNCVSLAGSEINKIIRHLDGTIDEETFAGCTNQGFVDLNITSNITEIRTKAFAGDANIQSVTVPSSAENFRTPIEGKESGSEWNSGYGEAFKDNGTVTTGELKIEAEDYNKTLGTGFYHTDMKDDKSYRQDAAAISSNGNFSNGHDVGYNDVQGDNPLYNRHWFNYTFKVEGNAPAYYTVGAGLANGGDAKSVYISFSGDSKTYRVTIPDASERTRTGWDNFDHYLNNSDKVLLKPGYHVIHVEVDGGLNLDYFTIKYAGAYEGNTAPIPDSKFADSWQGINPNHCEVMFTGEDDVNGYQYYRADEQEGWMYLLTKDIYENNSSAIDNDKNYDVWHQKHADVRLHRNFTGTWESLVLPFDVKAGDENDDNNIDGTVRGKGGAIDHAAILFSATKNHLDFLNVGTHNTKSEEYGSADYVISAGTPFIIHSGSQTSDDYVTFVDVETLRNATPGSVTYGDWTYYGTFNAISQGYVPESGVFALSGGSIVQATRTAKFKGYRGWFQKASEDKFPTSSASSGAKAVILDFNADDVADSTTSIDRLIEDGTIETTDAAYTLSGIRTTKMGKGIYIINGKKVVIK